MNHTGAPEELFREIRELDALLLELVATPERVSWHWPTFYRLYLELDNIAWRLNSAGRTVLQWPIPMDDAILHQTSATDAQYFGSLGKSYKACIGLLWQIGCDTLSRINDKDLRFRIRAHVHPKSGWYQAVISRYQAGTLSKDATTLERTIWVMEPQSQERIDPPYEEFLQHQQSFDLHDESTRIALASAVQATATLHGQVQRAFGAHLVAHCKIEDLLHPSSI